MGRAGEPVIVPKVRLMLLTATGTEQRRALVLGASSIVEASDHTGARLDAEGVM